MRMAFLLASADVQSAAHFVLLIGAPVGGDQQDAILAGPDRHSAWLDENEHVVDPAMLRDVGIAAQYPRPAGR